MQRYEIWWAQVRFEDTPEIKRRPVLIWNDLAYVIAYKMTSADRGDSREEFRIEYWKEAGLDRDIHQNNKGVALKTVRFDFKDRRTRFSRQAAF